MATGPHAYEADFFIGQTVFCRLDEDPTPGLVTGIVFRPGGPTYYVTWPDKLERMHYALELSETPRYSRAGRDD